MNEKNNYIRTVNKEEYIMLRLQQATTADCLLIRQMAKKVFYPTYSGILSAAQLEYMFYWMYDVENIRKEMEINHHVYFIVYQDGIPAGYLSIEQQERHLFHLQKIYVLPDYQGQHIGEFLFRSAIDYIQRLHPSPCLMELNVNRNNKAIEFYKRMGMKKIREGDFPIGNGYYMNDYIMGIEINMSEDSTPI